MSYEFYLSEDQKSYVNELKSNGIQIEWLLYAICESAYFEGCADTIESENEHSHDTYAEGYKEGYEQGQFDAGIEEQERAERKRGYL